MIGKTISHFKILKKLGEGGMGVVYKAEDTKLDRHVALKFLPSHLTDSEEEKQRFIHEAKSASALEHPSITTIYEIDEVEGQTFIAMECVEGETLKDKVEKGPLKTKEFLNIAIAVADGLNAAHEHDIVHRDIKSENIMIPKTGTVKIMDFGLAKRKGVTRVTKEGSTLGTLAYMSPEQAEGLEVDRRSDLYSFGVVMYEMATGQLPFKGEHDAAILYAIVNEAPLPVSTMNPNIPKKLEEFIHKALEKEVEDRYQHADELLADLNRLKKEIETKRTAITETPLPITKEPGKTRVWRRSLKTHRWMVVFGIILVALVTTIFLYRNGESLSVTEDVRETGMGEKSIAVLPFTNFSDSKEDEFFSDGITEDIITQISKIGDLKVIARTSVVQYKNTQTRIRDIGKELGVATVLEGSVRRSGRRIRIVGQLIDVNTEENLWAETYDRDLSDIFAIQSDVARKIALALKATLTPEEKKNIERQPTKNMEAYDYFLRGNDYSDRSLVEGDRRIAVQMYEKAIELDPKFALAYAKLSRGHAAMYWFHYDRTDERLVKAKSAANKSLELEPDLPEAHIALGYYYYWGFLDYGNALEQFDIAQKSQPNNSDLWASIGYVKRRQGEFEKALINLKKAIELDPRSSGIAFHLAETFFLMRDYSKAEPYLDRAISLAPDISWPYANKAWLYVSWQGSTERAREVLEEALEKVDREELVYDWVWLDLFDGDYEAALERLSLGSLETYEDQFDFIPKSLLYAQIYGFINQRELEQIYYDSARVILERNLQEQPGDARFHSSLGIAYAGLGRKNEAIREGKLAVELLPVSKEAWKGVVRLEDLAQIYAMVGQYNDAIDQLEFLLSVPGTISISLLRVNPIWDPLRDHPRFQKLIKKKA
ncbi:MAG: protein kinase [Candidatus Neomarinimicrobiota bacterium]